MTKASNHNPRIRLSELTIEELVKLFIKMGRSMPKMERNVWDRKWVSRGLFILFFLILLLISNKLQVILRWSMDWSMELFALLGVLLLTFAIHDVFYIFRRRSLKRKLKIREDRWLKNCNKVLGKIKERYREIDGLHRELRVVLREFIHYSPSVQVMGEKIEGADEAINKIEAINSAPMPF